MTTDAPMYIHFGHLPEGGRSWNHDLEQYEAGVSVYRAEWQSSDRDAICVDLATDACVFTLHNVQDRPAYIVTGTLLDERGGDGEPLLTDCTAELVGVIEYVSWCVDAYGEDY